MTSLQAEVLHPDEVRALAVPVLRKRLGRYGFKGATVINEELFYGGTAIRIVADLESRVPAEYLADTNAELRALLRPKGEDRFVFLVTRLPAAPGDDDQDDEG
ncbi:hypothetical protein [Aquibium microcysteis]|uniref:hypothetical protein n=1 Tax=Aquibium microcysteis TaxID=675281 RepID=UPI00165D2DCE|nr:hypothetical protein [Aquibium microcysteis]